MGKLFQDCGIGVCKVLKMCWLDKVTTVFILFFSMFFQVLHGQTNTGDSLLNLVSKATGEKKIGLLLEYSRQLLVDEPEKSLVYAKEAEILARKSKEMIFVADALKLQGDALFETDSLKSAAFAYAMAVESEEMLPTPRTDTLMHRLNDVGYTYQEMGLFDIALNNFRKALLLSRQLKDTVSIAENLSNIGVSLKMTGQYGEAIEAFQQTLQLDTELGNETDIALDYNNIGMVYQAWKQYDQALAFFTKALELDEKLGNKHKLSIRLSNIGQVYLAWGKPEEAIEYFSKALEIDREIGAKAKIAIRQQGLGLAYLSMHEYNKAIGYFEEAYGIFQGLDLQYQAAIVLMNLGDAWSAGDNLKNAVKFYKLSLELSQNIGLKPTVIDASSGLYKIYRRFGDFENALHYFEIYQVAQDSVFSETSARQINEFKIRYETEKMESQNQLLVRDNQIKSRNQRFLITLVAALIVLSASLFYAFSLKRKSLIQSKILFEKETELAKLKIKQVEKENLHLQEVLFAEEEIKKLQAQSLEQKNHELTSATLLIANKNETFGNLRRMAEQLRDNNENKENETLREMIREIDRQTDVEGQWEQFRIHFESIHKSFFSKLRENNPGLTQTDLQLCAYIKLNMATKEIARLMNITPESVNTHRYRLRKKLNLNGEETLDDFVHGI